MLTSLCINNPVHINAYLLENDLIDNDILSIEKCLSNFNIKIIPVHVSRTDLPENLLTTEQWSIETYFRLLMIDLLPESVDRILYLDVDLIINKDISDLYNIDFSGNLVCAASDTNGNGNDLTKYSDFQQQMFAPFLNHGFIYFNAGVMLYNMKSIRKIYTLDTYLNAMQEWNFQMPANDQDILNYVYHDKVLYIPWDKYDLFTLSAYHNGMTESQASEVSILHFAGYKPWDTSSIHYDIEAIWWNYARKTDIYQAIANQYITQMTHDKSLEKYIANLLEQINKQDDTINELTQATKALIEKFKSL